MKSQRERSSLPCSSRLPAANDTKALMHLRPAARAARIARLCIVLAAAAAGLSGCSVRQYAMNQAADALAASGSAFASDHDPELIRDAAPFSLKAMESLLEENPRHVGLLTATSRGFTQYAYAFVQQEGEELETVDLNRATQKLARARGLYLRARDYGLRGLEERYPGFGAALRQDARAAVSRAQAADVPLLYWTAASWAALINLSKDDPATVAELPQMEALIDRALALDETYEAGAIHTFLISYEPVRQGVRGDALQRSLQHFDRAMALAEGQQAAPLVALAETAAVARQDRMQFERLLNQALAIDVNARPQWRLANTVMQRRARWLLARTDELIPE
jgi:predicted anti-sigma-YlaC factor YlaD